MKCSFCDNEYGAGIGVTFFKKDGSALHFCSRRCEKYLNMKRNPRKLKWTGKFVKYGGRAKEVAERTGTRPVEKKAEAEKQAVVQAPKTDAKAKK